MSHITSFEGVCRRAGLGLRLPGVLLASLGLAGCQSLNGTAGNMAQVRVVDANPGAGPLDVYRAGEALAYNLQFGTISSYIPVLPASYTLTANPAGASAAMASHRTAFAGNGQYTVILGEFGAGSGVLVLQDNAGPAPAGQAGVRVVDVSAGGGAVDVYLVPAGATLAGTAPVRTGVAPGSNSGYFHMPSGLYTLEVVPAGAIVTSATRTLYTGPVTPWAGGSQRTLVIVNGSPGTNGVQVMTAEDFDPAG